MAKLKPTYDYVIVGAGSAGCVVANRLTEDGSRSVLLIEAGPKDNSIVLRMPAALGIPLESKRFNWGFVGEPEPGLNGRTSEQHRGRVLGGTSSINGMVFVRGNPRDFESWVGAGLPSWSYAHCLPYFRKMETFERGGDAYRGGEGNLHVSVCRAENPLYQAFLEAGQQHGMAFNRDQNGADQEGVNVAQATIHHGERESTAVAYLRPALSRPNLTLAVTSRVTKILFDGDRATGVAFLGARGEIQVSAASEVILSAGVYGSPQLLMLSGIGNADDLRTHGIGVVHHSPEVGQNLQDHVSVPIQYTSRRQVSPTQELSPIGRYATAGRWLLSRRGLGASNYFEVGAFFRSNDKVAAFANIQHEFFPMIGELFRGQATARDGFQYFTSVLRPDSRGHVKLRSANPMDDPLIQLNLLTAPTDMAQMLEGISITREIVSERAWDGLRGDEVTPGRESVAGPTLEAWVRANAGTNYHAVATCRMGSDNDAVTDASGHVIGVRSLRVIDASLMPYLVSANTNAATIMIAEKLADEIVGRRLPPAALPN
jgi:choline dehydrogenase